MLELEAAAGARAELRSGQGRLMGETRLAEVMAALSLATDLGMGRPMDFGLRVALLSVDLARRLGLAAPDLVDVYYLALVKHIGCTSDSVEFAGYVGGDDIGFRRRAMLWPAAANTDVMRQIVRHTGEDRPPLERARLVAGMMAGGRRRPRQVVAAHCEAGGRLAERLGLGAGVRRGLEQEQERWDGRGLPEGLSEDALSLPHRVVMVAHDATAMGEAGDDVVAIVRERAGHAYDPHVVDGFAAAWVAARAGESSDPWASALEAEPGRPLTVTGAALDRVALAIADFTDLKSPYLLGHSVRVAELVEGGGLTLGMPEDERTVARRAALLHDVGRTGISNGIWDKPGPLSAAELERVRLHAYYTERVLARAAALAPLAVAAGGHHENLDGSGYHRGIVGPHLSRSARLIRAADCFDAMTSDRPHRAALTRDHAARELTVEVDAGRLDAGAVAAVLEAAGERRPRLRPPRPGGLSDREIEVLRLMVRGLSNRQMGGHLNLSPKTVGHHVQHIYNKIGVTSRAAAALFAMESGLV